MVFGEEQIANIDECFTQMIGFEKLENEMKSIHADPWISQRKSISICVHTRSKLEALNTFRHFMRAMNEMRSFVLHSRRK